MEAGIASGYGLYDRNIGVRFPAGTPRLCGFIPGVNFCGGKAAGA
jgi:hypothetical protein